MKSTLYALNERRFMCGECISKDAHRPDLLEKKQRQMACAEPASDWGLHKIVDDDVTYSFKRCIGNYFNQSVLNWMSIYRAYEKGILPYPGSYQDQPNKALEVLGIIDSTKNVERIKKIEADKRRMQSQARRGGR